MGATHRACGARTGLVRRMEAMHGSKHRDDVRPGRERGESVRLASAGVRVSPVRGLLARALERLHAEDVHYCVLRDAERLPEFCAGGEVDLLAVPADLPRLRRLLVGLGFAALP